MRPQAGVKVAPTIADGQTSRGRFMASVTGGGEALSTAARSPDDFYVGRIGSAMEQEQERQREHEQWKMRERERRQQRAELARREELCRQADVARRAEAQARPAFNPVPIRTARDAEENARRWLTHLRFNNCRLTGAGADGGVDVRGDGVVAQVKAKPSR